MAPKKRITKKRKTVEQMPSLIFQKAEKIKHEEKIAPMPENSLFKPSITPAPRGARVLMWFGVAVFTLAIIFLWGTALKLRLDSFNWQKTPENKMIKNAKTDWDKYFSETKTLEENKNRIKDTIAQLIDIAATTTPSTSTTATSTK